MKVNGLEVLVDASCRTPLLIDLTSMRVEYALHQPRFKVGDWIKWVPIGSTNFCRGEVLSIIDGGVAMVLAARVGYLLDPKYQNYWDAEILEQKEEVVQKPCRFKVGDEFELNGSEGHVVEKVYRDCGIWVVDYRAPVGAHYAMHYIMTSYDKGYHDAIITNDPDNPGLKEGDEKKLTKVEPTHMALTPEWKVEFASPVVDTRLPLDHTKMTVGEAYEYVTIYGDWKESWVDEGTHLEVWRKGGFEYLQQDHRAAQPPIDDLRPGDVVEIRWDDDGEVERATVCSPDTHPRHNACPWLDFNKDDYLDVVDLIKPDDAWRLVYRAAHAPQRKAEVICYACENTNMPHTCPSDAPGERIIPWDGRDMGELKPGRVLRGNIKEGECTILGWEQGKFCLKLLVEYPSGTVGDLAFTDDLRFSELEFPDGGKEVKIVPGKAMHTLVELPPKPEPPPKLPCTCYTKWEHHNIPGCRGSWKDKQ